MFGKRFTLFRLAGFTVRADLSWLVIAGLVTSSLALAVFPQAISGVPTWVYWAMGVGGAVGLFGSIVLHEFSHSLVARRYGVPMKGITLFIFGGIAEMKDEPPNAKSEFMMAIAGPICSLLLAVLFFAAAWLLRAIAVPSTILGVCIYLSWINAVLVAFNMIPAFPLDGGRVMRAVLWGWKKDIRWATRISSVLGSWFGLALIGLGVFSLFMGNFVGGIWWVLIGFFLRQIAQQSYQQILVRQALAGESVRRFMRTDPVTVSPAASIRDLVENYIYRYQYRLIPVVNDGELQGCVTINCVKEMPKTQWNEHTVGEVTQECTPDNTIAPDEDATKALNQMTRNQTNRLMVVEDGAHLLGIVALRDLIRFLHAKLELETGHAPALGGLLRFR